MAKWYDALHINLTDSPEAALLSMKETLRRKCNADSVHPVRMHGFHFERNVERSSLEFGICVEVEAGALTSLFDNWWNKNVNLNDFRLAI